MLVYDTIVQLTEVFTNIALVGSSFELLQIISWNLFMSTIRLGNRSILEKHSSKRYSYHTVTLKVSILEHGIFYAHAYIMKLAIKLFAYVKR